MLFPTHKQFRESAAPQEFSLPMPIMKYIWEYPVSSDVYQKLIQCCKLFFLKNSMLVLNNLSYYNSVGWECCNGNKCGEWYLCKHKREKINITKLHEKKLWISKGIRVTDNMDRYAVSRFIPKIHQYNVEKLYITNQILSWDNLKVLANGIKECHLHYITVYFDTTVADNEREKVPLENIVKLFYVAKILSVHYSFDNFVCSSYDELIGASQHIEEIKLHDIVELSQFYESLKRSKNRTLFDIYCRWNADRLNQIIDEILYTKFFEFVPPIIAYFGQDRTELRKIKELQQYEASKYR